MKKFLILTLLFIISATQISKAQSYRGFVDGSIGFRVNSNISSYRPIGDCLFTTSHGLQIKNLFTGLGGGFAFWGDGRFNTQIPVFLDIRYDFFNSRAWNFFIDLKPGYSFVTNHYHLKDSFFIKPSIGLRKRMSRLVGLSLFITYFPSKSVIPNWNEGRETSQTDNFIGIGVGVDF